MLAGLRPLGLAAALVASLGLADPARNASEASALAERIRERRAQVVRQPGLTEEAREQAIALLERALEDATGADERRDATARLQDESASAEAVVSELRDAASRPAPEPLPPIDLATASARQGRDAAASAYATARDAQAAIVAEQQLRGSRREELPRLLAEARAQLARVQQDDAAAVARPGVDALAVERRLATRAALLRAQAEVAGLEAEIATWDDATALLEARLEHAASEVRRAESAVAAWDAAVAASLRREAEAAAERLRATLSATPALQGLAAENLRLAERRADPGSPGQRAVEAAPRLREVQAELDRVRGEHAETRLRIETFGVGRVGALLLRTRQAQLPAVTEIGGRIVRRSSELQAVQIEESQLLAERLRLVGRVQAQADAVVAALVPAPPPERIEEVRAAARGLLEERLRLLDGMIEDTESHLMVLFELDSAERQLVAETLRFNRYLDEVVLWTPSSTVLSWRAIAGSWAAVPWLFDPHTWTGLLPAVRSAISAEPWKAALLLAALLGLALPFGARERRPGARGLRLLPLLGRALVLPVLLWSLGWLLRTAPEAPLAARALGAALQRVFVGVLIATTLHQVRRPEVAAVLGWSPDRLAALRRANRWFAGLFLPAVTIATLWSRAYRGGVGPWTEPASRIALLVGLVGLLLALRELLNPERGLFADRLRADATGWLSHLRPLWLGAAFVVPLFLMWLATAGFGHTASALVTAIVKTASLVLGAAILGRWIRSRADVARLDAPRPGAAHSQRLRLLLGLALVGTLAWVWSNVLPALAYLETVPLWTVDAGGTPATVTAASVVRFVLALVLGLLVARALPGLTDSLLTRFPVDASLRYGVGMVAQYVVLIVAAIVAFDALHVGWSKLQWLAAGLSVGVGFGLQEIVANFIAGLIILFERPVRIGDVVTVGDTTGTVTRVHARSTTVRDFDGRELIVPNKELITTRVTNWDLSDRLTRLQVTLGVAYGSDALRVTELLLRVARECPQAIADPPPQAIFSEFGENALQFRLYVFLASRDDIMAARHALHVAIDKACRDAGIAIAFPQRDVHLHSREPLRVHVE